MQEGLSPSTALTLGVDNSGLIKSRSTRVAARLRSAEFEAIIGGIYLESGLEAARWFILEQLHPYLQRVSGGDVNPDDHKSKLQEVAQAIWRRTPLYRIVKEIGFSHDKKFSVQVLFDDEVMGEGAGRSKKEAEQEAARDALELIRARQARGIARA